MRLIRRFFVTITAAFIMFSAGHTASNAAGRYYTANKPGSDNITCVLEYKRCYAGYYLENGMCTECPTYFTSEPLNDDGEEACTIDLEAGEYYSVALKSIWTCPEGYYCPGDIEKYNSSNQHIGRFDCPAGHYCPKGSEQPTPCDAGYYCPKTKQSDQTVAQLDCGVGKYCPAGSANSQDCPSIDLSGDGEWAQKTLHSKGICQGGVTYATLKAQPQYDDNIKNAESDTDCQIKLEYDTTCGLVHLDNIKYDSGTYSNVDNLTSYYLQLNFGYQMTDRLYSKDICTTSNSTQVLHYKKAEKCTGESDQCPGLASMPTCGTLSNKYPESYGNFTCESGQYFQNTNSTIPVDCPSGSYCINCSKEVCPAGHYCPTDKMSEPTPCDPGYYCPQTGLKSQTICPKGYYCPDVKEDKKECEAGWYCPNTGLTELKSEYKCPTGATSKAGSDDIADCFLSYETKFQDSKGTFSLPMGEIYIIATGK